MFSQVVLNPEQTVAVFGYHPNDLSPGSHSKVVVECENCHRLIHREYRNVAAKHQCPVVEGSQKRCFQCGLWKDLSAFNKCQGLSGGVSKMCRECFNQHKAVRAANLRKTQRLRDALDKNDIQFYVRHRLYNITSQCKRDGIPFDLDLGYLIDIWGDGTCYYTGLPMNSSLRKEGFQAWDAPSIDRRIPSKGYIKGNVVWCVFGINSFKQSLNEEQFEKMIKKIKWWFE